MATKVVSILQILAQRGGIVKTTNTPGAWAIIAQWRRYFELKGEDADEEGHAEEFKRVFAAQLEQQNLEERMEETVRAPISDPGVVEARKQFTMEYLRNLTQRSFSSPAPTHMEAAGPTPEDRNAQAERIVNNPDLGIPVGDEFLYLAQ